MGQPAVADRFKRPSFASLPVRFSEQRRGVGARVDGVFGLMAGWLCQMICLFCNGMLRARSDWSASRPPVHPSNREPTPTHPCPGQCVQNCPEVTLTLDLSRAILVLAVTLSRLCSLPESGRSKKDERLPCQSAALSP